jgi:tetratricopeptide (TPR) repeat protein
MGLLLGWAGPAGAARRPEVAVVGVHLPGVDEAAGAAAVATLGAALEDGGVVDALDLDALRQRLAGREPLVLDMAFLGPGRARLDEGRVLYDRADFEGAVPVLEEAVAALEDGSQGATDLKNLLDALLVLGLARLGMGDEDGARAAFQRFAALDPARQLDPVNHPPKVVARFDAARAEVMAQPRATLDIEAPEGAVLYLDGLRLTERRAQVPPGEHFLTVEVGDGRRQADRLRLEPGQKLRWTADGAQRTLAVAAEGAAARAEQTSQLYKALGNYTGTGLVLLAGQDADGRLALQLFEPRTGTFSKAVQGEAGADPVAELADLMPVLTGYLRAEDGGLRPDRVSRGVASLDIAANALLADLLLDPAPVTVTQVERRGPPWYVWAGVGALAAGGATAAVVALTGGDDPQPGETITETQVQGTVTLTVP